MGGQKAPLIADALVAWLRRAEAAGVYVEYHFNGSATALCGADALFSPELNHMVETAIDACGTLDPAERWLALTLDRTQELVRVECAASGCFPQIDMGPAPPGAEVEVLREKDSFLLRVALKNSRERGAGDTQWGREFDAEHGGGAAGHTNSQSHQKTEGIL